jgi:hypothetical protein
MIETPIQIPASNKPDKQLRKEFNYKGLAIEGLDFLEAEGITTRERVINILAQLPDNYSEVTQVSKIMFDNEKCFTLRRGDQVLVVKESGMKPGDSIMRRVRGMTIFNNEEMDGKMQATDGKQTITVFSTKDWEAEDDSDVSLYTLAHELGHGTWNAIQYGPQIWNGLQELGRMNRGEIKSRKLSGIISAWKELPESKLPRYVSYKSQFFQELNRDKGAMNESELDVAQQEDFATAHEYQLYWHNLKSLDTHRSDLLSVGYEIMGELT